MSTERKQVMDENARPETEMEERVIGDVCPAGSLYADISSTTGTPMYATRGDAVLCMTWFEALDYAAGSGADGRDDWRLPTAAESALLYEHRERIGTFNTAGGWHWASCEHIGRYARTPRFSDSARSAGNENGPALVRCVREEVA